MALRDRWRRRHAVLACCVLAYFGVRFVEFALSLVFPAVEESLGVSPAVIGLAVTASTATYALAQLPSGALGDRFGERAVIVAALALTGVASLLLALSPSGAFVVLGMGLVGLVSGAYYSPATALLTARFEATGRAIGVHRIGAQLVGLTGPAVALVAARFGWRAVLLAAGGVAFAAVAGFGTVVDSRSPVAPDASLADRLRPDALADLLSRPGVAFTTALAGFAQFADTAAFSFLPLVFENYHDISTPVAGALFTVYFAAVTAGQPVSGWLSDAVGRDTVTVGTLTAAAAGFLALARVDHDPMLVGFCVVLVGLGMGWGPPVQSRLVDRLDVAESGVGFGLARTTYIGFAAAYGVVVGATATAAGWQAVLLVLAAVSALPAVALVANGLLGIGL